MKMTGDFLFVPLSAQDLLYKAQYLVIFSSIRWTFVTVSGALRQDTFLPHSRLDFGCSQTIVNENGANLCFFNDSFH